MEEIIHSELRVPSILSSYLVWRFEKIRHCWKLTDDNNSMTTLVLLSNTLLGKAW